MAGTLADMKARIASELARADLTTQIANAINDAIGVYQKERWRFNEPLPDNPKSFVTVAGRATYTEADLPDIATVEALDFLNMAVGTTLFQLRREDPEVLKLYNQQNVMMGQPGWWAYQGNEILLAAVPDQPYTIYIEGVFVAPAPANDAEANNPWMTTAERLIRARAKFEIATHVTRNAGMAQAMSPEPPTDNGSTVGATYREWRILRGEANRVQGRGRVRPSVF